jgi:hypothetical protein
LDRTPPPGSNSFCSVFHCIFASWGCYPFGCAGYAYWLFSQDGNVYNYTGRYVCVWSRLHAHVDCQASVPKTTHPGPSCGMHNLSLWGCFNSKTIVCANRPACAPSHILFLLWLDPGLDAADNLSACSLPATCCLWLLAAALLWSRPFQKS